MKIDNIPTKVTVKAIKDTIFTGKKYCFAYVDIHQDWSWDGESQIIDFAKKSISVLWSEKELKKFKPNYTVHNFLLDLKEGKSNEIKRLRKARQKRYYKDKRGNVIDLGKIRKERIDFLNNNDIRFFEINFVESK